MVQETGNTRQVQHEQEIVRLNNLLSDRQVQVDRLLYLEAKLKEC